MVYPIIKQNTFQSYLADGLPSPPMIHDFNRADRVIEEYWHDPVASRNMLLDLLGQCHDTVVMGKRLIVDLGKNIFVGRNVSIGDDVVFLDMGMISIGNNVVIGDGAHIYNAGHEAYGAAKWRTCLTSTITIGDNVRIGEGSVILPGTHIYDNTDTPPGCILKGPVGNGPRIDGRARIVEIHKLLEEEPFNILGHSISNSSNFKYGIEFLKGKCNIIKTGLRYRSGSGIKGSAEGFSFINAKVMLDGAESIVFGNHCLLGPGVKILTNLKTLFCYGRLRELLKSEQCAPSSITEAAPVTFGDNVFISGRAIVLPGVTIGDNTTIFASNGIIYGDIPSNSLAVSSTSGELAIRKVASVPYRV